MDIPAPAMTWINDHLIKSRASRRRIMPKGVSSGTLCAAWPTNDKIGRLIRLSYRGNS
jgi:hypothetical protein